MSADVHNLLPEGAQNSYPRWLNLAVGYGARNLGYPNQTRFAVIGIDINLARLLPEGGPTWNWIRQTLQFVMVPAPTLEFKTISKPQGYVFYPFKIKL
jgi:hypothetical protein